MGQKILRDGGHLEPSVQQWDWLGHGIYFWEGNPGRAMAWAVQRQKEGKIEAPFVLGAIIDLRHCLDLFDHDGLAQVKQAHRLLMQVSVAAGTKVPRNVGATADRAGRGLDCAVMNTLHQYRKERQELAYDSVRGPFLEGEEIYPGAGFRSENHIQLSVRNAECVKGYFRPLHSKAASF
ncbi:MAG TPA: hypothetical protein VFR20_13000 [Burkholderiaceae bacterium]|nr:hypothetical protein [Burkholderiaceae bacterium]